MNHRETQLNSRIPSLIVACLIGVLGSPCSQAAEQSSSSPAANLDPSAILAELRDVSAAGISRKLGPDYRAYHPDADGSDLPDVYMPPARPAGPPAKEGVQHRKNYELGGPWTPAAGDFSSTQGQVLYAPDHGTGVDRVTIIEMSNNCFSEKPEPPWNSLWRPEPTTQKWIEAAGSAQKLGVPLASARGLGSWANCGLILFSSGFVGTAGTVTARGTDPSFAFPANKLPTAISVTNKNEFALVTVIDTDRNQGQIAVLALSGAGTKAPFPHDWAGDYPCLPNVAILTQIKLLGYIDLPGIRFPTGLAAVGNRMGGRVNGRDGNAGMLSAFDLKNQGDRDIFYKGPNFQYISTGGFAVVVSKYESKVAFVDLRPLFARVRSAYLTTEEDFQKTRNLGMSPDQWPYAFDVDPSWQPKVAKVMNIDRPTAALGYLDGGDDVRAFVASEDGTITGFHVGNLVSDSPFGEVVIRVAGTLHVGRNPTCLAFQKGSSSNFLAVSRGDRKIDWISWSGEKRGISKTLSDRRMIDPVYAEVADTHGIETQLITVADFAGRQIINYRYSQLVFATQGRAQFGMGPDGKDPFECGGVMNFPGHPFSLSAANVN